MRNKKKTALDISIGITIVFLVTCIIIIGTKQLILGYQSQSWPTADGIILSSKIKTSTSSSNHRRVYSPIITYEYTVADQSYVNSAIRFGQVGGQDKTVAQAYVSYYPAGTNTKVSFNPAKPEQSILESGISWKSWAVLFVGFAFLSFGIFLFSSRNHSAFKNNTVY